MTSFAPKSADKKETSGHQHAQSAPIAEDEQYAQYDTLPDIRLVHADPRVLSTDAVLHLQRTLGNQTVQRLLVNREQDQAPAADTDPPGPAHRSYSDEDLIEIFGEFEPSTPRPEVPTYEVIAGSTGAGLSRRHLQRRAAGRWHRHRIPFTQAARQAAGEDPASMDESIPTQSPHLPVASGQPYDHRWALTFFAWDYQDSHDLPDIRTNLRAGSPFRSALEGEFSRTFEVENPTATTIVSRTNGLLDDLVNEVMYQEQIAELVIVFSGHGANGGMTGVDEQQVSSQQLHEIGERAQGMGIHIVFIMDICHAGNAVNAAQGAALEDVRARLGELPTEQADALGPRLNSLSDTMVHAGLVNIAAEAVAVANHYHGAADSFQANVVPLFGALDDSLADLHRALMDLSIEDTLSHDHYLALHGQQLEAVEAFSDPSALPHRWTVSRALRRVAGLLDVVNTIINGTIEEVNAQINAASGSGQQAAGGGPGAGGAAAPE